MSEDKFPEFDTSVKCIHHPEAHINTGHRPVENSNKTQHFSQCSVCFKLLTKTEE